MSPEKQRIAIAEACGFEPNGCGYWIKEGQMYGPNFEAGIDFGSDCLPLPDYLNDLNACAEMQQHLGPAKATHAKYWSMLHGMVVGETPHGEEMDWRDLKAVGIATAAMKCECFLKSVGRWEP